MPFFLYALVSAWSKSIQNAMKLEIGLIKQIKFFFLFFLFFPSEDCIIAVTSIQKYIKTQHHTHSVGLWSKCLLLFSTWIK